jgi:hypothetical protein
MDVSKAAQTVALLGLSGAALAGMSVFHLVGRLAEQKAYLKVVLMAAFEWASW